MKETIYTIPVNDAFDSDCACPLCFLHNKLENELVESAVGAGMMEPDHRENSNSKGFCKTHIKAVYSQQKALPLALVLQSYIEHQNNNIIKALSEGTDKKGLFKTKSSKKSNAQNAYNYINEQLNKCSICDTLDTQMQRYVENTVHMWKTMPDFKVKFNNANFCLEHFNMLLDASIKSLNDKLFEEFFDTITKNQTQSLTSLYSDITEFVNSFDYRFSGELSQNARNSTVNAIKKFIGTDV